jgi:hypothetical protein
MVGFSGADRRLRVADVEHDHHVPGVIEASQARGAKSTHPVPELWCPHAYGQISFLTSHRVSAHACHASQPGLLILR